MMHFLNFVTVWIVTLAELQLAELTVSAGSAFSLSPFLDLYAPLSTNHSQCYNESIYFRNAAKKRIPWALRMLDASSKIPSSLLVGNTADLGNFDDCLAVRSDRAVTSKNIVGKYCFVTATFNQTSQELTLGDLTREWSWSVCMPASCSARDLIQHLENSFKEHSFNAHHVQDIYCRSSMDDKGLPLSSWIFIIFALLLLVLILVASYIEHKSIETSSLIKSVVLPFSLVTNVRMLLSAGTSGQIQSMHGIRTICMLAIITLHRTMNTRERFSVNRDLIPQTLNSSVVGVLIVNGGLLAVDAFFLMSGVLLARGFMAERKAKVPFSYCKHIVHRFLRITPAFLFVIMTYATVFYELGSGPVWEKKLGRQKRNCAANWWINILYFHNYVTDNICMDYSWYLAADMQMYIIAPIFLFVLHKSRRLGMTLLIGAGLVSCLYSFAASYDKGYPWSSFNVVGTKTLEYLADFYIRSEIRMPPYLIGLLLGYFLEHFKKDKIVLGQLTLIVGWTIVVTVLIAVPCLQTMGFSFQWGVFRYSLFQSLHRTIFCAAIGWIVFICDQGYGGTVDRFLSHRWFQIMSKLSFCFYLIQFLVIYYDEGTRRTVEYFSFFSMFQKLLMDIFIGIIGSAILSLALEYPFIHLNKLLFKKEKREEDGILTEEEKKPETSLIIQDGNKRYCIFT